MQPLTDPPRDKLTADQVRTLIGATLLQVDVGCELLDADDTFLDDISADLQPAGSLVDRRMYATVHGGCRLRLSRQLDWGSQRLRPYMLLSDGHVSARFDLGVYLPSTPVRPIGETPETYDVEGYDKLEVLDTPVGKTVRVAAGTAVVAQVRTFLNDLGEPSHSIESSDATLPSDRLWPLDERTTWLHVINDLLGTIGYRGLWCDWGGRYRSETYRRPADRAPEWVYGTDEATTIVGPSRRVVADFFDAPNRWVFIRNDPAQGVADPATTGVYEVVNQSDGPTSIDARGRTISKVELLDVASQAALVARGDQVVDTDKRIATDLRLETGPNPLHWHFDVVTYDDPALGGPVKAVSHAWTLPLDGGDMTHEWRQT